MYSVSRKNCENTTVPTSTAITFAAASVRSRKMRSGRSGAGERISIARNAAISTADAPSRVSVRPSLQPDCAVRVSA